MCITHVNFPLILDPIEAASIVFSHWIFCNEDLFRGQRVLELGAGCGLTGMAAHLIGGKTTTTDLGIAVNHLRKNIELNQRRINSDGIEQTRMLDIECCELDWTEPEKLGEKEMFDIIIGSEVIYREPILEPLVNTVDYHLKEGGILYLVSARDRGCYLDFFHRMTKKGYTIATKALTPAPLEETEFGWESIEMSFSRSEELSVGWFCEVCSCLLNIYNRMEY